jgi:hypothetical protein
VYAVETDVQALPEIEALPGEALAAYAELMVVLETAPWSGSLLNRDRPSANMRSHIFGRHGQGMVIYYILEDERRVIVVRVMGLG